MTSPWVPPFACNRGRPVDVWEFFVQGFRRPENLDCLWVWCPLRVLANTSMTSRMVGWMGRTLLGFFNLVWKRYIGHLRGKETICESGLTFMGYLCFLEGMQLDPSRDCRQLIQDGLTWTFFEKCICKSVLTQKDPDSILLYLLYVRTCISYLVICWYMYFRYPTSWHLWMSVSLSSRPWIVRSFWSQMKRPRWSLITGAAWCWLMFWSQPLAPPSDVRCYELRAKVGVCNKYQVVGKTKPATTPVISLLH